MKYLVFGSMNIDKVYFLDKLPEKGETLSCKAYEIHVGGKGLNQSVSLAKAGAQVYMAGYVGSDGDFLCDFLNESGVNTDYIKHTSGYTGHAVIEVDGDGQNQMILFPGANREITTDYCDSILEDFSAGDVVLMQYETSQVEYMISKAKQKGMTVALNPSPYVDELKSIDYGKVDYLILNESEGMGITGEKDVDTAVSKLTEMSGAGTVIMTLGAEGAVYAKNEKRVKVPAFKVNAVDTTGAGDTYTGYILTALEKETDITKALTKACAASAVAVSKAGAAQTIPSLEQVEDFLNKYGK